MHIWVYSQNQTLHEALVLLMSGLGFTAHSELSAEVDVGLIHLSQAAWPYPAAPPVPTLALSDLGDMDAAELRRLGYKGCLRKDDSLVQLKEALEVAARGELWVRH